MSRTIGDSINISIADLAEEGMYAKALALIEEQARGAAMCLGFNLQDVKVTRTDDAETGNVKISWAVEIEDNEKTMSMAVMEQYIGTKIVMAKRVVIPDRTSEIDDPVSKDYLEGKDGYAILYPDGYESFCPKEAFEEAYRRTNGMPFGLAIEAAKKGKRIARTGWNGKGMFVVYQKGYPQGIPCNEQTAKAWGMEQGELFRCEPYLQIKMVNGSHAMWVPSINDVLADDWQIVD